MATSFDGIMNLILEHGKDPDTMKAVVDEVIMPFIMAAAASAESVRPYVDRLADYVVDRKIAAYKRYVAAGIPEDHAVLLVSAEIASFSKAFKK